MMETFALSGINLEMPLGDSQYESASASSISSSGGPVTPLTTPSTSRRPSIAIPSTRQHDISHSMSQSRIPITPEHASHFSMDPFVPYAQYLCTVSADDASFFGGNDEAGRLDESFLMASSTAEKQVFPWDPTQLHGSPLESFNHRELMVTQDNVPFAPTTGANPSFSRPMFDQTQSYMDFSTLTCNSEGPFELSPRTVVPSQTFARPMTPPTALADPFLTPVKVEVSPTSFASQMSDLSYASTDAYSPYASSLPDNRFVPRRSLGSISQRCQTPTRRSRKSMPLTKSEDGGFEIEKIHAGKNPCLKCGKAFRRGEHLKRHQKSREHRQNHNINIEEAPWLCVVPKCDKKLPTDRNDNIKAHLRTHLKPKGKVWRNRPVSEDEAFRLGIYDILRGSPRKQQVREYDA